jgi:RimJ/RimL family protein N-acetyltransferase
MTDPPRSIYRRDPGPSVPVRPLPPGTALRPIDNADDAALGTLIERAYTGTIDEDLGDNSDGAVEITDWRAQGAIASASFVAVDAADRPVAASLVTGAANGSVWIGYVFTDPGWKGQGLGTAVVAASLGMIAESQVFAGVTDGNTPSERLLTSLGFVRTGPV